MPAATAYLSRIRQLFVALIAQAQKSGEFRDDYEPAFLAQMAVGMLNSSITRWLADAEHPVKQGLVEATEFVLNVLSRKSVPIES